MDVEVVFEPDCEWDVQPISEPPAPVVCVKPQEKRAVQGCYCPKCTEYRR